MKTSTLDEAMNILGVTGPKRREWTYRDVTNRIRQGLPFPAVEKVRTMLHLDMSEMANFLAVSTKTLSRKKHSGKLGAAQADRLYRIAKIIAFAEEVLGDREAAVDWIGTKNRALGGVKPLELLDTTPGEREVENLLGTIKHGIYT